MRLQLLLFILMTAWSGRLGAQTHTVQGRVVDTAGQPLPYVTVALLDPADSTLAHYGISGSDGRFQIKTVGEGQYLLQAASMEVQTYYRSLQIPGEAETGTLYLQPRQHVLNEVTFSAEKLPLMLKGDTIEYNAGAYRTRPDAVVEDLLKKLPGVEVDRDGNLKAQGKQVSKVLVDGKEFFGNDPKVATKNLPADAISKVQVFDGKTDAALFTGIDDGEREKTINLELKDGKKMGYFGSLQAGAGSDERYKLDGKVYRFRKHTQFAALAMANNINEFGFTLDDYLNFQGGLASLMDGGGNVRIRINAEDNLPLNFGNPVYGLIHSGAGGLNYTWQASRNRRLNISYLGNGADKRLNEDAITRSLTREGQFEREERASDHSTNAAHRLNLNMRYDPDSTVLLSLGGSAALLNNTQDYHALISSIAEGVPVNSLDATRQEYGRALQTNGNLSLTKKWKGKIPVLKVSGQASYRSSMNNTDWTNLLLVTGDQPLTDRQFQDDETSRLAYSGAVSTVYSAGKGFFAEVKAEAGTDVDVLNRRQGLPGKQEVVVDSLSPDFSRQYRFVRPGLSLQRAGRREQFRLGLAMEWGASSSMLAMAGGSRDEQTESTTSWLLPSLMWRREMGRGNSLTINYEAQVQPAAARQMLPVANIADPLQRFTGNRLLRPEYGHEVHLTFVRFDEFNFSSFFVNLRGQYTEDKINWSRTIYPDLRQELTLVNVPRDYSVESRVEYSTPVRKLGITVTGSWAERYSNGITVIDQENNKTVSWNHEFELRLANRKKTKWDVQAGSRLSYTTANYSLRSQLNNRFYNLTHFAELSYRPTNRWYFAVVADIASYYGQAFVENVNIPLLKAEAAYYFLKYNRGALVFNAFDLLNSNTGLQRVAEMNYLMERHSNIISQYFMLSFRYRLSKAEGGGGNVIKIGR